MDMERSDGAGHTPDGAAIVSNEVGDFIRAHFFASDTAELEVRLSLVDLGEDESALDVVENSVGDSDLGDVDHVHEANGVFGIAADLLVDADETLFLVEDDISFAASEGELQLVTENDLERNTLAGLVRAGVGLHGEHSAHLVHEPALGGSDALHMFLGSSCHLSNA